MLAKKHAAIAEFLCLFHTDALRQLDLSSERGIQELSALVLRLCGDTQLVLCTKSHEKHQREVFQSRTDDESAIVNSCLSETRGEGR